MARHNATVRQRCAARPAEDAIGSALSSDGSACRSSRTQRCRGRQGPNGATTAAREDHWNVHPPALAL